MPTASASLRTLLFRHQYLIKEADGRVLFVKSDEQPPLVRRYRFFALALIIMGGISILLLNAILIICGIVLISIAVPILRRANQLRYLHTINRTISTLLTDQGMSIQGKRNTIEIAAGDVERFVPKLDREKNITVLTLSVQTASGDRYPFLQLYGANRSYLEDDARKIGEHIRGMIGVAA